MGEPTSQLYSEIKKDPEMLQKMDKIQFVDTPLHKAAARGDTSLAIEIMNLMPSFGTKLNPQGLSPLHVAIEKRQIETANALLTFDKQLVRVKGKDGLTPFHCAAKIPNQESVLHLLGRFLLECPDSIKDLNNKFQTAVHVALESRNFDAFELLVKWHTRSAREPLLSRKDGNGNTAIHTAAQHGRLQEVKGLVKLVKLNKKNSEGKTPLDIVHEREYFAEQMEMIKVLRDQGGRRVRELLEKQGPIEYLKSETTLGEAVVRAYYFVKLDLSVEMRNVILVVAVLISTATYQGVLQPPGGVYQASADTTGNMISPGGQIPGRAVWETARLSHHVPHRVGEMVMEKRQYGYFMPANTFAFVLSTVIIIFVLPGRPFIIILQACLIFMCLSYLLALIFVSGSNSSSKIIFILSWLAILYAFISKILFYLVKAFFDDEVWWLRRLIGVKVGNLYHIKSDSEFVRSKISFALRMRKQYKLLDNNPDIHD